MNRAIFALLAFICAAASTAAQTSAVEVEQRATHRRAVEAVIWGMPAVNYDPMLQEMLRKTTAKQAARGKARMELTGPT